MCRCRRSRSRSASRDLERAKHERSRERRVKGLPPFKEEHLISKHCITVWCDTQVHWCRFDTDDACSVFVWLLDY